MNTKKKSFWMAKTSKLLKAFEGDWGKKEEIFELTKKFFKLQEACPEHACGQKNYDFF